MRKSLVSRAKHTSATPFADRRQDKYRELPSDYSRARHRALGPSNYPTIYDTHPSDLTAAKGLGPKY